MEAVEIVDEPSPVDVPELVETVLNRLQEVNPWSATAKVVGYNSHVRGHVGYSKCKVSPKNPITEIALEEIQILIYDLQPYNDIDNTITKLMPWVEKWIVFMEDM